MDDSLPDPAGERFLARFCQSWPLSDWRTVTVVIAVSGGADSVCLLRAMRRLCDASAGAAHQLVAAHVNHGLRGAESDADEAFVRRLCQDLNVPCEVTRLDPPALLNAAGRGSEAAARHARYHSLSATATKWSARFLATAHTADDQAETVLHRLLRGTGLRGLAGIPRSRPLSPAVSLIRPLLGFRRHDILAFLQALGQPYRDDSTNRQPRFTRNRLRHHLLPLLARDYSPHIVESLLRLAGLAGEMRTLVDPLAEELASRAVVSAGNERLELNCEVLGHASPFLVRELAMGLWKSQGWPLRDMNFEKWSQLAELAAATLAAPAATTFPGGVRAERKGPALILTRRLP